MLSTAQALKCQLMDGSLQDCSVPTVDEDETTTEYADACYSYFNKPKTLEDLTSGTLEATGCIDEIFYTDALSKPGHCEPKLCMCHTDNCNTPEWAAEAMTAYQPPPMCFIGIGGTNNGPECQHTDLHEETEPYEPSCDGRITSGCVENKKDGETYKCANGVTGKSTPTTEEECKNYLTDEVIDLDDGEESLDGTNNICTWRPIVNKTAACELDDGLCTYDGSTEDCEKSEKLKTLETEFLAKIGANSDCEIRARTGCLIVDFADTDRPRILENGGPGEPKCYEITNATECVEEIESCEVNDSGECLQCTWVDPEEEDMDYRCRTYGGGSADNLCAYTDGTGAPTKSIVSQGFGVGLFKEGSTAFNGKCSMIASYRDNYGAATALGYNTAGVIQENCENTALWGLYGENTNHTAETITEYCNNFIPNKSAMNDVLKIKSPGAIIAEVKAGNFANLFPDLEDLQFIVTKKPEFGECLFTAEYELFGAAICTCDTPLCNNEAALHLIVDRDVGPMRLLQFIDGSLILLAPAINKIVPGLMDDNGVFVALTANSVTQADVTEILEVDGVASLTTSDELWGIVQDYQILNSYIAQGGDPNDPPESKPKQSDASGGDVVASWLVVSGSLAFGFGAW